jgi:hypothetical protein
LIKIIPVFAKQLLEHLPSNKILGLAQNISKYWPNKTSGLATQKFQDIDTDNSLQLSWKI